MYLTAKQHDKLQIIVTGFEVPYRSFIASKLISIYPKESNFSNAVASIQSYKSTSPHAKMVNSEFGKIKSNPSAIYQLLVNANTARVKKIVDKEINVPSVAQLIALTVMFREHFGELILCANDEPTFLYQAANYKYVRNKLDHRGCKTLELSDMNLALDFISNLSVYLSTFDSSLFWDKEYSQISKEVASLQTKSVNIPIEIHNIQDMPFPEMRIVCRDEEVSVLKQFVYGRPGALRKQPSFVLYGYGGVGKTALVLEAVKQIVQDLQDETTINNYSPDFLLFFTAKEESLDFSHTTGKIQRNSNRHSFGTANELISSIYNYLKIESFSGFKKNGLIIVDNVESLSAEERKTIEDFINYDSPLQVQYIITSRNEENYSCRKKLAGFEGERDGAEFIKEYIAENNCELTLSDAECSTLLQISRGNTLVLVLCLRRLSLNIITISGIISDITVPTSVGKLKEELENIPPNGFDIISEYMFKNSFQEIQNAYKSNESIIAKVLQIFAVRSPASVDLYTLCTLIDQPYSSVSPILELLCHYLIVEKVGDTYYLNQFAEKYIIQQFMPDHEKYEQIESEVITSIRRIHEELEDLQRNIDENPSLKKIIQDWNAISGGDKIAIAKAFKLYREVSIDCKTMSRFAISSALQESIEKINILERNTMHPYIKFQKARILKLIHETNVLDYDFTNKILQAYSDTVWTIKTNPIYGVIRSTKSYASVLWLYGMQFFNSRIDSNYQNAARYLEESKATFEQIKNYDKEYYQCLILLGNTYLKIYNEDRMSNLHYLRKARSISSLLYEEKDYYSEHGKIKSEATILRDELRKYGRI